MAIIPITFFAAVISLLAAVVPANAATRAAAVPLMASHGSNTRMIISIQDAKPARPLVSDFTTSIGGGAYSDYPCNHGHNWNYPIIPIFSVFNACDVRVWLHEDTNYENGHGWAECVSPGAYDTNPRQDPHNIQISNNGSACNTLVRR